MEAAAELEARKMRLSVKQKRAADVMEKAIGHLADMKQPEYIAFLVKKIAETGVKEGQLILNARDKAAVGAKLIAAANESLQDGKLTLADQVMNAKGGFILRRGAMEINSSLETMVHSIKEKVTAEVVAALFQE
jgi:vacuolar-type H+-ATPase subunit E/Vma4